VEKGSLAHSNSVVLQVVLVAVPLLLYWELVNYSMEEGCRSTIDMYVIEYFKLRGDSCSRAKQRPSASSTFHQHFIEEIPVLGKGWITPLLLPSPSLHLHGKWWLACRWAGWWWWWVLINHWCHVCHVPVSKILFAEINKIYLPQRLVWTGPDQSLCGPGIFEMAKDRGPDCGCGPVWSCDFRSWVVRVQSSPSLFRVLWPDFQTLIITSPFPLTSQTPTATTTKAMILLYLCIFTTVASQFVKIRIPLQNRLIDTLSIINLKINALIISTHLLYLMENIEDIFFINTPNITQRTLQTGPPSSSTLNITPQLRISTITFKSSKSASDS